MRSDEFDTAQLIKKLQTQVANLRDGRRARGSETVAYGISQRTASASTVTITETLHDVNEDRWVWSESRWSTDPW